MKNKAKHSKIMKHLDKKKVDTMLITILKNKGSGISVTNKKEAQILCKLFDDLGLKWDDGKSYTYINTNSGKLYHRTKIGSSWDGISAYNPRIYYPFLGKISKRQLKKTTSLTYQEFLDKAYKHFFNN